MMSEVEGSPVSREDIVEEIARALHDHGPMSDEDAVTDDWLQCSHASIHSAFAHKIADRLMGLYGPRRAPDHPWSPQLALAKMGLSVVTTTEGDERGNSWHGVHIAEAPSVISAGETEDEALANLFGALGEWVKAVGEGESEEEREESVRVATTKNLAPLGLLIIDGVTLNVGDRVLVKDQYLASDNDIWIVGPGAWTRATDVDANAKVCVAEGVTQADTEWVLSDGRYKRVLDGDPASFRRSRHDLPTLGELATSMDHRLRADRIDADLDYEDEALDGLRRSWLLDDRECQALALADAQVWATLHLARVTKRIARET